MMDVYTAKIYHRRIFLWINLCSFAIVLLFALSISFLWGWRSTLPYLFCNSLHILLLSYGFTEGSLLSDRNESFLLKFSAYIYITICGLTLILTVLADLVTLRECVIILWYYIIIHTFGVEMKSI